MFRVTNQWISQELKTQTCLEDKCYLITIIQIEWILSHSFQSEMLHLSMNLKYSRISTAGTPWPTLKSFYGQSFEHQRHATKWIVMFVLLFTVLYNTVWILLILQIVMFLLKFMMYCVCCYWFLLWLDVQYLILQKYNNDRSIHVIVYSL